MIHSRVSWMSRPVDRSMTVSAPQSVAQRSFSTSSSIDEDTAELPMLALIFTAKLRPMIIGSSSGWLTLAGMMARPRATSDADELRIEALRGWRRTPSRRDDALRAKCSWVTPAAAAPRRPPTARAASASPARDVVPLRPARVVDAQRLAVGQRDLAHRHRTPRGLDVDLAGVRKSGGEIGAGRRSGSGVRLASTV